MSPEWLASQRRICGYTSVVRQAWWWDPCDVGPEGTFSSALGRSKGKGQGRVSVRVCHCGD